jgi:cyclopropane fatty-acyl-phospholipid synthase-like methyltransferase
MIRQFLRSRGRVVRGLLRTRLGDGRIPYDPRSWWDERFFTREITDSNTIWAGKNELAAAYHYASMELLLLRHFRNDQVRLPGASVCDLGSGAGHWIRFYRSLGAARCTGIDVSAKSVAHLRETFQHEGEVSFHQGTVSQVLGTLGERFDVVNAIGVMFHIVVDEEWRDSIRAVSDVLRPGGLFVVGAHFGMLNGVNVQFDSDGTVNKRLRSAREWKRALAAAGLQVRRIYRNRAYLFIEDALPENNILVARKV